MSRQIPFETKFPYRHSGDQILLPDHSSPVLYDNNSMLQGRPLPKCRVQPGSIMSLHSIFYFLSLQQCHIIVAHIKNFFHSCPFACLVRTCPLTINKFHPRRFFGVLLYNTSHYSPSLFQNRIPKLQPKRDNNKPNQYPFCLLSFQSNKGPLRY